MKHVRRLKITPELAWNVLVLDIKIPTCVSGIPADGRIVGCEWEPRWITLLVETAEEGGDLSPLYTSAPSVARTIADPYLAGAA